MFALVLIHMRTGEIAAHGPFSEKRNAQKACDWYNGNPSWYATIVPMTRPANPADATKNGPIQLERPS